MFVLCFAIVTNIMITFIFIIHYCYYYNFYTAVRSQNTRLQKFSKCVSWSIPYHFYFVSKNFNRKIVAYFYDQSLYVCRVISHITKVAVLNISQLRDSVLPAHHSIVVVTLILFKYHVSEITVYVRICIHIIRDMLCRRVILCMPGMVAIPQSSLGHTSIHIKHCDYRVIFLYCKNYVNCYA